MFGITWGEVEIMAILLPIDAFNLYLLVKLYRWSQTVGKNLIGQVVKSLNLKRKELRNEIDGDTETVSNALSNYAQSEIGKENLAKLGDQLKSQGVDLPIDQILEAYVKGEIGLADLRQYAPLIAKMLFDKNSNAGTESPQGRW